MVNPVGKAGVMITLSITPPVIVIGAILIVSFSDNTRLKIFCLSEIGCTEVTSWFWLCPLNVVVT